MSIIMDQIITIALPVIVTTVGAFSSMLMKNKIDEKSIISEDLQIEKAVSNVNIAGEDNVMDLMMRNVKELKEYYVISKNQARNSFSASLFISIFGIFIYIFGLAAVIIFDKDILLLSTIAGTMVELISGLFFWLYSKAINQLSVYHQRLGSTEKYLMVTQLINEVPEDKKYEEYSNLINFILNDNQVIVKSGFDINDKK